MRFELVTLFPEFFEVLDHGLLGKAKAAGKIELCCISPREFTHDRHRTVDDAPYGGGSGMVLMPGPFAAALDALDAARGGRPTHRVLLTPQGERFSQSHAQRLARLPSLTLVCGRYEGFDERIRGLVDEELSLGDFVLLGGETAALAIIEGTWPPQTKSPIREVCSNTLSTRAPKSFASRPFRRCCVPAITGRSPVGVARKRSAAHCSADQTCWNKSSCPRRTRRS